MASNSPHHDIEVITQLTEEELYKLAEVGARGFAQEPNRLMLWALEKEYKGNEEQTHAWFRLWIQAALDSGGDIVVNKTRTGFRCRYPPGVHFDIGDPSKASGKYFDAYKQKYGDKQWFDKMHEFGGSMASVYGEEIGKPCWMMMILCVDPSVKHQGVGKALQDRSEKEAREQGLPVRFATEKHNLPMYQRRGYQVRGETDLGSGKTGTHSYFIERSQW